MPVIPQKMVKDAKYAETVVNSQEIRYKFQASYSQYARKRDGAGLAGASRRKFSGGSILLYLS